MSKRSDSIESSDDPTGSATDEAPSDPIVLTQAERDHAALVSRRKLLVAGSAGVVGLAGCADVLSEGADDAASDGSDDTEPEETDDTEPDETDDTGPRNAILLIPDGASGAHITAARYVKAFQEDPDEHPLNVGSEGGSLYVDQADSLGYMCTFPDDPNQNVTDSGAAGTALSTGVKTYSGAIGGIDVDGEFQPVETILEVARETGMATGLVTTTRLTHATPAAFAAHVPDRGQEDEIAAQYVDGGAVDVLLGGGPDQFTERGDGRDLVAELVEEGYQYVETAQELSNASTGPILGLFGSDVDRTSHMSYYVDRLHEADNTEPMLADMTEKAIEILSSMDRGRENGFFLMVESGRVDHLGHDHDPAIAAEQLECDEAFGRALDYVRDESEPDTVLVQAPDHETGGLTLGTTYDMDWEIIAGLQASAERFTAEHDTGTDVEALLGVDLSASDVNQIESNPWQVSDVLNDSSNLGWGTTTHSSENVPVHAAGYGADRFGAHFDNTDVPRILADLLEIELSN